MKIPFDPHLKTPPELHCKEELNKRSAKNTFEGTLREELRSETPDLSWEAEQLAKSHGIYLEYNRAVKGSEKDWIYMVRVSIPGGGPITKDQWRLLDELSEKWGRAPSGEASLRLTTRQNIQFHWVKKKGVLEIVKRLAESGLNTLNGCGDNTRNVMACPLSRFSDLFNANELARKTASYFQLPAEPFLHVFEINPALLRKPGESFSYGPQLLNRKFKIAFSTLHRDPESGEIFSDNCTEILTNDLAVAPLLENGRVARFQIYAGGGQGERNGKPGGAMLAQPLGIVTAGKLQPALAAVVNVHQEWGDRQNRFWARIKYVVKKMGAAWLRERAEEKLGFRLEDPQLDLDYGAIHLHHGWSRQPQSGLWNYGLFLENGRITDSHRNGRIKTLIRELLESYPVELLPTPNQDLIFSGIPDAAKKDFEKDLDRRGYGKYGGVPFSALRRHSVACVGLPTCRLSYTDSELFEPELIDQLEKRGWGKLATSIGVSGCERQCSRPATKAIGLVGSGLNRYQLKLLGTEDGRHQGLPVIEPASGKMLLRSVPRDQVPVLLDALFKFYEKDRKNAETLGAFHRRIGLQAVIDHLRENPATAPLLTQTSDPDGFMV